MEELQLAQQAELLLLIDAVVLGAQLLVYPRQFRGKVQTRLVAFLGSFCRAIAVTFSSSSGISGRSVWIGGGVANTIWCRSFCRLPARNGRVPVSSSYITAPSEYRSERLVSSMD